MLLEVAGGPLPDLLGTSLSRLRSSATPGGGYRALWTELCVSELDELLEKARETAFAVLRSARQHLQAGGDAGVAQRAVTESFRLLEDAETYALLAGSPERTAEGAIEECIASLEALRDALRAEG
ncbi:MAG TPA: hypothetical protein VF712_05170 [Thermoleophilaceae bacterium]|jgi:hypothetical protein